MGPRDLQQALGVVVDGQFGPKSKVALAQGLHASATVWAALLAYVADRPASPSFTSLGLACLQHLPTYGVSDTPLRLANFLGQACHETGGFRFLKEIWGPTAAQKRYEGRLDLGNTQPGDGERFKGRGIFQTTGRGNYNHLGAKVGVDLCANPTLLETPDLAVLSACVYWDDHGLSGLADSGREDDITRKINGGYNGQAERRALVARAKGVLL